MTTLTIRNYPIIFSILNNNKNNNNHDNSNITRSNNFSFHLIFYFNLFPYRRERETDRYDSDINIAKQWETNNFLGFFFN